jgi:hypothetical protein
MQPLVAACDACICCVSLCCAVRMHKVGHVYSVLGRDLSLVVSWLFRSCLLLMVLSRRVCSSSLDLCLTHAPLSSSVFRVLLNIH